MATATRATLATRQANAVARAAFEQPELSAFPLTADLTLWKVYGRTGNEYVVRFVDGAYRCECKAAEHEQPCWHTHAVEMRRMAVAA